MDTVNFNALEDDEYKAQTQKNWGKDPCGSRLVSSKYEYLSKEYFDELEKRKDEFEPWKKDELASLDVAGKKVLEIGYGMGCDTITLARKGAIMTGIDITEGNKTVTTAHFKVNNMYIPDLIIGDAEHLPFADESFDFVYSFGVIHHTPNTDKVVAEMSRVLKSGGGGYITVYNKNSFFFWFWIFFNYVKNREWKKYTLKERLSMIEYPNENKNMVIKLYTKRQLRKLFSDFSIKKVYSRHLMKHDFIGGHFFSERMLNFLGQYFGWYNIIRFEKK